MKATQGLVLASLLRSYKLETGLKPMLNGELLYPNFTVNSFPFLMIISME